MGVGGTDATGRPRGSESARPAGRRRIHGYDVIRGFSVVSMVGFHLCYDLAFIEGVSLPWFRPPFQDVWRASISWTFLLVAGMMCSHSRSNLRRAARYLCVAAAIYVVTLVAAVDTPISYGIIYCMGVSTFVAMVLGALLDKVGASQRGARTITVCTVILVVAFLFCLEVPQGRFGLGQFGGPSVAVPLGPYRSGLLSWLGFPGPTFASGDYYPPLPNTLLYLAGVCIGRLVALRGEPTWLERLSCRPLEWVGRHALPVYVLHQPVLLAITMLVTD